MNSLAPLVLFVYNRLDYAKKCIEALDQNELAAETEFYIYSDGPKEGADPTSIYKVREYVKEYIQKSKFKSVTLVEAKKNKGLASSIITGVSEIIEKYGKVIVIEDDNISSSNFLKFMNDCLNFYQNDNRIWSIGGYSSNLVIPKDYSHDVYLMGRICSYAWGTWVDRWEKVDWNVTNYKVFQYNYFMRKKFNRYGDDRSLMLDAQQHGKTNSWAIRFCYAQYLNGKFTIWPVKSKIKNIGFDVGTHVSEKSRRNAAPFIINNIDPTPYVLDENIRENEEIRKQFASHFHRPFVIRILKYIKTNFF